MLAPVTAWQETLKGFSAQFVDGQSAVAALAMVKGLH